MFVNSKGLSLLLSTSITLVVSASLWLIPDLPPFLIWLMPVLTFIPAYILISVALEFFFFKALRGIYRTFEKIKRTDWPGTKSNPKHTHPSLRQIQHEIYSYAHYKQLEIEKLKQMANFRRQFLADVSHELKTPIFAAQGFVHTLLDGAIHDTTHRMRFLKKAAKNLDGLDELVQDLLMVSQMESGDIIMQIEPVNICDSVYDIFDQLEARASKHEVRLEASQQRSEKLMVLADGRRIRQVLINLISNAMKYSDAHGSVMVAFHPTSGDKVRISVTDKGIGIPAEELNRIFERFYRVDKSRSKAQGGTGLGLSIAKHIVEAHESEIKVESTLGRGSSFSFELSVAPPSPNRSSAAGLGEMRI